MTTSDLVRRSRLVAAVSALTAAAAGYAAGQHRAWFAVPVVLAVLHAVLFRRLSGSSRWGSVGFRTGRWRARPALVVPRPQVPYGSAMILASALVAVEVTRLGPAMPIAVVAAFGVFGRSALLLTPDGIRLGSLRRRPVRWDDIDTERLHWLPALVIPVISPDPAAERGTAPAPPADDPLSTRGLAYDTNVNALLTPGPVTPAPAPGARIEVNVRGIATDHGLIARAIAYYVTHPAARADIGTPSGSDALVADGA
ncbi:hypothetical protein [Cryptosporangium japonicum]|uniref:PH domain-containing protein n=1 Tax=Cryptosporangium japonicum TaxID=80872 RepID=A0ABP3EUG5_9ACTN